MALYSSFLFFDAAHIGPPRTLVQSGRQLGELSFGTGRIDFDAAIVHVADITTEAKIRRGALHEVAESHTLHTAADKPSAGERGRTCRAVYFFLPCAATASIAAFTFSGSPR